MESQDTVAHTRQRWSSRHAKPAVSLGVLALLLLFVAGLTLVTWPVAASGSAHPSGLNTAPKSRLLQQNPCEGVGTDVSGDIVADVTWSTPGSPYHVIDDVTVLNDRVLTIDPGVVVCFAGGKKLKIGNLVSSGRLDAEGNSSEAVLFTADTGSPSSGFWAGIEFAANSPDNVLRHCVIEYAGTGVSSGDSDRHVVDQCTLRYNNDGGDPNAGGAINFDGDGYTITGNQVYGNELGFRLRKSFNNSITGNTIYDNDGFGIGFIALGAPGGDDNTISSNEIYGNGGFGLGFIAQGVYEGGNGNTITGNEIYGNGGDGLTLDGGTDTFDGGDDNVVENNEIYDNDGHGVWAGNQEDLVLTGNVVRGNGQNGLTYSTPNFGPDAIHSNVFCSNTGFNLQNLWATTISAEGNWFGTNTPAVDGKIDGAVAYTPWIQMDVTLVPDQLPADGVSTADFTLTLRDGAGHWVPDGYTVNVSASQGSLASSSLTLSSGQATTTYTAGTTPGWVDIYATDGCGMLTFEDELELQAVDLAVAKTGPGGSTKPGDSITYVIEVSELNGVDALGVVVTDDLPVGTTYVSDTGADCGLTLEATSPNVRWTKDVWTGGTSCQFEVTVLVSGDACQEETLVNSVEVTSLAADDDLSNNTATTSTDSPAILCLDLAVSKDDGDGVVPVLEPEKAYLINYTVSYANEGYVDASGVSLTDNLPSGTEVYESAGWTCAAGECTFDVGPLPVGGPHSAPPLVVKLLPETLSGCPNLVNEATIDDDGTQGADFDPDDNSTDTSTPVPCLPDLVLSKTDNLEECVDVGDEVVYTLTYGNVGLADATGVVLTEQVPAHTEYAGTGWICVGDTCTRDIGTLTKGESGSVEFVVEVIETAPEEIITNVASIASAEDDIDPGDNEAQDTTEICPCQIDLQVTKTASELIVGPNKEYSVEYTITVANAGATEAPSVVLTDILPDQATYTGSDWTCTGGVCRYEVGSLAPSATTDVPLTVRLDRNVLACPIVLVNTVEVVDSILDCDRNPDDNTTELESVFECLPDLVVVLNDNVGPATEEDSAWVFDELNLAAGEEEVRLCVEPGGWISYTVAYVNAGLETATQVVLTEIVPEHTSYRGYGWTCVGDTCTLSLGTLEPGMGGVADFAVQVDTAPPDWIVENEVRIDGAEEDLYPPDNVSYDDTPICELCLKIRKDDNLPCAVPGDEIRYTIAFTEVCGVETPDVVLTEFLPAHTSYLSSSGWQPLSGERFAYEYGTLGPYGSDTVEFVVKVDDELPETVTETVNQVCISQGSPAPPGHCFSLTTPLPLVADLRVVKEDHIGPPPSPESLQQLDRLYQVLYDQPYQQPTALQQWEPVRPGDVYSYTITYLNLGREPATGVLMTETLPAHTSYVGHGWTHVGGNTYTYRVGDLGVREGGQREFWVRVNDDDCSNEDYLYNWVHIGGNEEECNLNNNWSGEETPVEYPPCEYGIHLPLVLKQYPPRKPEPTPVPPAYVSDVAANPETNRVYVASPQLDAVLAVDPTGDGSVIANIPVGQHPLGLAVVSTTNKIYAANLNSWTVTAIRGSDHTRIADLYVGAQACKAAADSADERVYVTNHLESDNGAAAINSQTDTFEYYYSRLHATQGRYGIDVDPAADKLFIAARDAGLIAIQDAYLPDQDPQLVKLNPPRVPYVVAFNPTTEHLFVTAADDNVVVVLDPYSIQWDQGSWVTIQGREVFLLDRANAGWVKEIGVGLGAEEGIAVNPLTGYVYITNAGSDSVSILLDNADPAQITWIKDIDVGDRPQGVDVDVNTNQIYVGNAESRDLTVIDGATHTVVKTIPLD